MLLIPVTCLDSVKFVHISREYIVKKLKCVGSKDIFTICSTGSNKQLIFTQRILHE